MLLGVPMLDSGIKRYPLQNRPRIIQYAITVILREKNQDFIASLRQKLQKIYPLHQPVDPNEHYEQKSSVIYIHYPGEFNLIELVPLSIAMTILFVYMYFSIRKVEMIRSRFIVAISSVVTVLGSLVMSLGFCFFFGISIWTQSSMGVYPYLLILVGLENCLVLTKSVMTTENNLDVKIRVAQGLSKEGWPITKNLLTEITILTAGLVLTFLPLIQEFCIFAIVGLVSDYFLQMFLFSTVLGLNVKRVAVIAEVKKLPRMLEQSKWQNHKRFDTKSMNRSISHPSQLSELDLQMKDSPSSKTQEKKIPKRLRIVNFWARTRLFQRGFMIWMVLWISNIIYTSGIIESVFLIEKSHNVSSGEGQAINGERVEAINSYEHMVKNLSNIMMDYYAKNVQWNKRFNENMELNITDKIQKLKHPQFEISNKLSSFHWAGIFKQYNISMIGRYVTILPSIKVSHVVPVEVALKIRNPNEIAPSSSKWNALASALDPLDLNDADGEDDLLDLDPIENQPLYPKTPTEMVLLVILCAVSVFVITYTMVVMYRCICSRNYAEWRASRWDEGEMIETDSEQVLEGFPIQVKGHKHNVECVVSDGNLVASSCLQGLLKIWDASNGELVAEIDRISYFEQLQQYNVERQATSISDENLIQKSPPSQHQSMTNDNTEHKRSHLRLRNSLMFDFQSTPRGTKKHDSDLNSIKNEFQRSFDKFFEPVPVKSESFDFSMMQGSAPTPPSHINNNNFNHFNVNHKLHNGNSSESINSLNLNNSSSKSSYNTSPIWALDFIDNLIVIGCADGRLEFWEGTTGSFKCIYQNESTHGNGVTHIKLASDKVVAARLSGRIDFLRLETYTQGRHIDWNFTSAYRRTHVRTGSAGSISNFNQQQNQRYVQRNSLNLSGHVPPSSSSSQHHHHQNSSHSPTEEELRCILELQHQGHTQPITSLDVLGNLLFTGSQDHTLKVFHTESNTLHFTLHGHCSPVTALLIDRFQSGTGCSGSQDGLLCVWDLITGI